MKGITSNPALDAYQRMAITPVGSARPVQKTNGTTETSSTAPQVAKVSISPEARELAATGTDGTVDSEKVDRLRSQVESGTYQVNSKAVAERMLAAIG